MHCANTTDGGIVMKISTKGRYALRLMVDLCLHNTGASIPLRDIAERQEVTVKYPEQIIPPLCRSGFLQSTRGAGGGYRLAKPASAVTVGDILRATEGDLAPVACLAPDAPECPRAADCPTLPVWQGLNRVVQEYLDSITLEDVANSAITGGDYSI